MKVKATPATTPRARTRAAAQNEEVVEQVTFEALSSDVEAMRQYAQLYNKTPTSIFQMFLHEWANMARRMYLNK